MAAHYTQKDFLEALFLAYCKEKSGFVMVRSLNRQETKVSTRYFPNVETLCREQYPQDYNVFLSPSPRDKMKPGKEYIKHITCLWAGLDIGPDGYSGKEKHFPSEKLALAAIRSFPLPPSIIVRSGVGMHLYWLLNDSVEVNDPEPVETLLRRINEYFQCRSDVTLDSLLRIPGTYNNRSPAHSFMCHIERLDTSLRYGIGQFQDLDLRIIIPSKRTPRLPLPTIPVARTSRIRIVRGSAGDAPFPEMAAPAAAGLPGAPKPICADETMEIEAYEETPMSLDPEDMQRIAEYVVTAFSEQIVDELADRIVEKLFARMNPPTG